jgi:hypothetical protein
MSLLVSVRIPDSQGVRMSWVLCRLGITRTAFVLNAIELYLCMCGASVGWVDGRGSDGPAVPDGRSSDGCATG